MADQLLAAVGQLLAQKRFAEAVAPMHELLALMPQDAGLHAGLAQIHLDAGQPEQAVSPLRRAIEIDGRKPGAHWLLGCTLQILGIVDEAITELQEAVRLQPSLSDAHYRLGLIFEDRGDVSEAVECFRRAARTATDAPLRQFIQARIDVIEGREGEAADLLRRVIKRRPDMPMAHNLLGEALTALGRSEEAAQCFEEELVVSPHLGMAYYHLVRSRKVTDKDTPLLERLDALLAEDGLSDYNRANLLLARGKAFDDADDYRRAMECWDAASVCRARVMPFDSGKFRELVDWVIAKFTAATFAGHASAGSPDRTPVLIFGMPRSGTTLCEQIVASHPDCAGAGELAFWDQQGEAALQNGFDDHSVARNAAAYLDLLRRFSATARRVSDKAPTNYLCAGLFHLAFPRAAMIHCRRSAIDTAISIHQTHFARGFAFPTGGQELVEYFREYERLMAHWRSVLPPGCMLEVEYEQLTASPEQETRKIIAHLGLPWSDTCLRPQDNPRIVRTPSRWQVREAIHTRSVERWKRYEPWLGTFAALTGNPV